MCVLIFLEVCWFVDLTRTESSRTQQTSTQHTTNPKFEGLYGPDSPANLTTVVNMVFVGVVDFVMFSCGCVGSSLKHIDETMFVEALS